MLLRNGGPGGTKQHVSEQVFSRRRNAQAGNSRTLISRVAVTSAYEAGITATRVCVGGISASSCCAHSRRRFSRECVALRSSSDWPASRSRAIKACLLGGGTQAKMSSISSSRVLISASRVPIFSTRLSGGCKSLTEAIANCPYCLCHAYRNPFDRVHCDICEFGNSKHSTPLGRRSEMSTATGPIRWQCPA